MFNNHKTINELFVYWLLTILLLIFCIIIVGGLTRLTGSGLSITEWELFSGILPPLTQDKWMYYFDLYKKIPQYKFINYNMTLEEFKVIFYWEYFHRIFARVIGLFFILPLIYFYITKKINKKYLVSCLVIFLLILLQGLIGWLMVKSGLVDNVSVSHYKLSLHLFLAMIIISAIFWLILNVKNKKNKNFFDISKKTFPFFFLFILILIQIVLGAFVSGLDAGRIYQTWPLMGTSYVPDDITFLFSNLIDFNTHSLVQFYHRNLAYVITLYILFLCLFIFLKKIKKLYLPMLIIILLTSLQISLGILTLISDINIYLASTHQITSALLVLTVINLYYSRLN